jgi:hypothetical protein
MATRLRNSFGFILNNNDVKIAMGHVSLLTKFLPKLAGWGVPGVALGKL